MRLSQLYSYFTMQIIRSLMFKAFIALAVILGIYLSSAERLLPGIAVQQTSIFLGLAYFIVATASSIIEKSERYSAELILSKPFTRRDIIVADFLSNVTTASVLTLLLTSIIASIYGVRTHEWHSEFLSLALTLIIDFSALYCFVILSGILLKNVAIVTVLWIGYLYVGAAILEGRSDLIYPTIEDNFFLKILIDGLYYLLPQVFAVGKAITLLVMKAVWNLTPIVVTICGGMIALLSSVYLFNKQELE